MGNDTAGDLPIDPASVIIVKQPSVGGTVTVDAAGVATYVPPNPLNLSKQQRRFKSETFTYIVKDENSIASNEAAVTVKMTSPRGYNGQLKKQLIPQLKAQLIEQGLTGRALKRALKVELKKALQNACSTDVTLHPVQ